MIAGEPYEELPDAYWPGTVIPHRPPIFAFGPAYTYAEIVQFGEADGAFGPKEFITNWGERVVLHLNKKFELPPGQGIDLDFLYTKRGTSIHKEPWIIFKLRTNYTSGVPRGQMEEIKHYFTKLGKRPMWWISDKNTKLEEDYRLLNVEMYDDDDDKE
ncbi:hypothetical protein BDN72DRAFT_848176 [Pluteus cervinus]|uniref:Uncharacterized protein n=1 Tax=Pluteus cervinus TaxID=181527 RepID=A0ACD3AC24_9AGAR|nr:hypothetical protein BDN72DRAFT_848176 [Pluteus cervinus]